MVDEGHLIVLTVGMGADPGGIMSFCKRKGIVVQSYSPLGTGRNDLLSDPQLKAIGAKHGKSSAAVALKWIVQQGYPLAVLSTKAGHLRDDLDIESWSLAPHELALLTRKTRPASNPSFACSSRRLLQNPKPPLDIPGQGDCVFPTTLIGKQCWGLNKSTATSSSGCQQACCANPA